MPAGRSTYETNTMDRETQQRMLDALYTALNLEGVSIKGAHFLPAYRGLDVPYHFRQIRAAIRAAEAHGLTRS